MPLGSHLALRRDAFGPADHHPVARAAVARRDLLRPLERRVTRDGPPGGVVAVRLRAAEVVVVLQDVPDALVHAVEVRHLVEEPDHATFGARLVSGGTTPSCFCRASVASRTASQPWSNLPLYLAIHSFGTWCGAWVAPGAK